MIRHPAVIACLEKGLQAHTASTTGSSMRIARALLMVEPPSIDGNELTDKGYINQRAGLERRAELVDKLCAALASRRGDRAVLSATLSPFVIRGCAPKSRPRKKLESQVDSARASAPPGMTAN